MFLAKQFHGKSRTKKKHSHCGKCMSSQFCFLIFFVKSIIYNIALTFWFDEKIWQRKILYFPHCEAVIANIAFVQKEAIFQEEERKERIKVTKLSTLSTSSNSSRTISFDEFRSRFKPLLPCSQFRTPHIRTSCGSSFQNVKESYVMWSWFDKSFNILH